MVSTAFYVLFLLLLLNGLNSVNSDQNEGKHEGNIIETINDFGFDLLKIFDQDKEMKGINLFYSPTSIAVALAMVFLGSRGNTADEIAKAMKWYVYESEDVHLTLKSLMEAIAESEHANLELKIANRLWGHEYLHETAEYKESILAFYNAPIAKVDFKEGSERAREEINQWVEKNTGRKIKDFLPPGSVTEDTRVALINAIYFQGTWLHAFDREKTHHAPFHTVGDGERVLEVSMMTKTSRQSYHVDEEHNCQILELPYDGDDISMLTVLPNDILGISSIEQLINTELMEKWIMSFVKTTVKVSIPRFILSQHFELKKTLSKLGISDVFEAGIADLSGLSSVESLYVSHVIHKAQVHVNEKGTEAAAASGVIMQKRSVEMYPEFYADHPFLFIIYHKSTRAVLFIGRVTRPEIAEQGHFTTETKEKPNTRHYSDEL